MDYLASVVEVWRKQLARAKKHKKHHFGKTARRLSDFLGKNYRDIYVRTTDEDLRVPWLDNETGSGYRPRLNKVREFVSVVLPWACAKVPTRLVAPRRPPLPPELLEVAGLGEAHVQASMEDKALAWFLQWWLSYTPAEYGFKRQLRTITQEALVKGRGVGWHELVDGPTGEIPGTFYDSVDNLFIDPDCQQWREANFIYRRRRWPAWRLSEMFGIPVDEIRHAQAGNSGQASDDEEGGSDWDDDTQEDGVCTWYEIWSRMGMGDKLYHADEEMKRRAGWLESLGQHVYLAMLPGMDSPLNLPRDIWTVLTEADLRARLEWPIAFFESPDNPFPCTPLDVYACTDNPWATSPQEGALSLQIFLDHLYSFIFGRVRSTCRDLILTAKTLEEELKTAIRTGIDQIVVPADEEAVKEIENLVHVIQFPEVNKDLWQVLSLTERAYERATGMDPLLGGHEGARQIRSPQEVGVRQANVSSRPNDYADAVEDFAAASAAKEAAMTRLYVKPQTVAPLFREPVTEDEAQYGPLTLMWGSLVNTPDPAEAVADLYYTTESGSGRRKNRQAQKEDLTAIGQILMPSMNAFAVRGFTETLNNFVDMIAEAYETPLDRVKFPEIDLEPPEEKESSSDKKK